ncbi:MAG: TrmH family RNA methyltransferase [Kiritimatiellia bacterium]
MNSSGAMRVPRIMTERRAWQVALQQVQSLEAAWDDPVARQRAILACRQWLARQEHLPHLHKLAGLLDLEMSRRQLGALLAPVERAAAQRRVTDADILEADAPASDVTGSGQMPLTIVVDCLRSAFNLGGVFRTAECLGVARVWVCGYTPEPAHAQVAQAAMGTEKLVPWQVWPRVGDALEALRTEGVTRVALETVRAAPTPDEYGWTFPCALVLGNERFGLDPGTLQQVDGVVRIPVHGRKNSLNVVTAFAVCGYAVRRAFVDARLRGRP